MCEVLGLPPSYIYKVFPEMTLEDVQFLKKYGHYKIFKQLEYLGKSMNKGKK